MTVAAHRQVYLVQIEISLPPNMPAGDKSRLLAAERERGLELIAAGVLVDIWRVPGRLANVGIWSAPDASALHDALASLPLFPWIDARVTALAVHPLRAGGLGTVYAAPTTPNRISGA